MPNLTRHTSERKINTQHSSQSPMSDYKNIIILYNSMIHMMDFVSKSLSKMIWKIDVRPLHCLKRGQSLDITFSDFDDTKNSKYINVEEGIVRICLVSKINSELFPIGFFGSEWLNVKNSKLRDFSLRLEALNDVRLNITTNNEPAKKIDSIFNSHWLLILCMIKASNQVEIRISRLIAILVFSFGKRNKESYTLPFELSHSHIALLVGCTRSTVTRQLGLMKEKGLIRSDKSNNGLLVSEKLILQESIFVENLQFN